MFLLEWLFKLFKPKTNVEEKFSPQENTKVDYKPTTHIRDVGRALITVRYFNSKNKLIKGKCYLDGRGDWVPYNFRDSEKRLLVKKAEDVFRNWLLDCAESQVYPIGFGDYIPASRVIKISVKFQPLELKFKEPDREGAV